MTEKRFNVFDVDGTIFLEDHQKGSYHIGQIGNVDVNCLNDIADRLNELHEENQRLKAQLTADIDGVCSLCNHHYLVKDEVMQGFYTSKCEKGHEKCSKEAVKYCDDFDLKEGKK